MSAAEGRLSAPIASSWAWAAFSRASKARPIAPVSSGLSNRSVSALPSRSSVPPARRSRRPFCAWHAPVGHRWWDSRCADVLGGRVTGRIRCAEWPSACSCSCRWSSRGSWGRPTAATCCARERARRARARGRARKTVGATRSTRAARQHAARTRAQPEPEPTPVPTHPRDRDRPRAGVGGAPGAGVAGAAGRRARGAARPQRAQPRAVRPPHRHRRPPRARALPRAGARRSGPAGARASRSPTGAGCTRVSCCSQRAARAAASLGGAAPPGALGGAAGRARRGAAVRGARAARAPGSRPGPPRARGDRARACVRAPRWRSCRRGARRPRGAAIAELEQLRTGVIEAARAAEPARAHDADAAARARAPGSRAAGAHGDGLEPPRRRRSRLRRVWKRPTRPPGCVPHLVATT